MRHGRGEPEYRTPGSLVKTGLASRSSLNVSLAKPDKRHRPIRRPCVPRPVCQQRTAPVGVSAVHSNDFSAVLFRAGPIMLVTSRRTWAPLRQGAPSGSHRLLDCDERRDRRCRCSSARQAGSTGDWRGAFYPERLPVSRWLEHYATRFPTVENNGTFYRLAAAETFAAWRARTPAGFVMASQGEPIPDARPAAARARRSRSRACCASATALGDRLGPVLLQLPPTMHGRRGRAGRVPGAVLGAVRPPGHASRRPAARLRRLRRVPARLLADAGDQGILAAHDAALCWSDRRGRPLGPLWRTADWGYVRFHEGAAQPWPRYGRQALRTWISRVTDSFPPEADVFAYFNNDQHAAAPADADALMRLADQAGWPVQARPVLRRD